MHIGIRKILAVSAAVGALLLAAACGSGQSESADATAAESPVASTGAAGQATGAYRAGTYDAEGHYTNPAGPAQVDVEVTLDASGTISAVKVTPEATGGNSLQFQTQFANGISAEVVGKKIDSLSVSKVAGSSLTGSGFNAALREIVSEAKG